MSEAAAAKKPQYFEDFPVGKVFEFGAAAVTEAAILAFAHAFDPQVMHIDPDAAAKGPTQGLIASGWHTGSIAMRLYADHILPENGLPGPGVDELRWHLPVRPGDTLSMRVTVLDARVSQSKPDRGVVNVLSEIVNQRGETAMSMKPINFFRRRP